MRKSNHGINFYFCFSVKCVRNRIGYFAERLHHSMQGAGTHDSCLIRVIVSRSEIDLQLIKSEYARLYGRSIESHIAVILKLSLRHLSFGTNILPIYLNPIFDLCRVIPVATTKEFYWRFCSNEHSKLDSFVLKDYSEKTNVA